MFPNPQDALPLPPRPNIEQYKKLAKELVKARADDAAMQSWAERWAHATRVNDVLEFARRRMSKADSALVDAQLVIARSYGFESWPKFAKHIEGLAKQRSPIARFEAAADAIITGDLAALQRLLRDEPSLTRTRSTREHAATLLHYISANGVEGYRQKTPKNAVDVARVLLDAGAEVDAEANVYGGGCTTLGLTATSQPPLLAGLQNALLELLLEYGAGLNSRPGRNLIVDCFMNGCPGAAEFLANRGAGLDLEAAAGLGRIDLVERLLATHCGQLQRAFLLACGYGRKDVVELLLNEGADLRDQAQTREAALHWAVMGGDIATIRFLIERGAPLEELNGYGGTALGQALWSFINDDSGRFDYAPVVETLLAAEAKIEDGSLAWLERQKRRSSAEKARIADMLRRYGATT